MFNNQFNFLTGTSNDRNLFAFKTSFSLSFNFITIRIKATFLSILIRPVNICRLFHFFFTWRFTFFIIIFIENTVFFVLLLQLFLLGEFCLMFFWSSFFFVKGFTQICELYSNHQIKHKECTKEHTKDKEGIVPVGLFGVSDNIHHIGPPFKRYNLEYIQNGHENIVKIQSIWDWILILQTLRILNPLFYIIWY